jgi:hypothetical protein
VGISKDVKGITPKCLLTIVIPTRNRASELELVLRNVVSYLYDTQISDIQVVVSNNGGDKATKKVVESFHTWELKNHLVYLETPIPFPTAEEHLLWLYSLNYGEFVWFLGDQDEPTAAGLTNAIQLLRHESQDLDFLLFNFSTSRKDKLVSSHYFGPDFSSNQEVTFVDAVQKFGYWAGICGISNQVFRSSKLNPNTLGAIIKECGPIYAHMTHHLHEFGDRKGLVVYEPLVCYELNDLSDGNDSSWRKYALKVKRPFFDPWLLGFLLQIDFLEKRKKLPAGFLSNVLDYEVGLKDIPEVIPLSTRIKFSLESHLYQVSIKSDTKYSRESLQKLKGLLEKHLPELHSSWDSLGFEQKVTSPPKHYVWGAFEQFFLLEHGNFFIYKINEEFLGIYKPHRELLRYAIKNSQFLCSDHFFRNIDLKKVMQDIDKRTIRFTCTCSKDNFHRTAYLRVPHFILVIFLRPYYRLPLKLRTRIRRFLR